MSENDEAIPSAMRRATRLRLPGLQNIMLTMSLAVAATLGLAQTAAAATPPPLSCNPEFQAPVDWKTGFWGAGYCLSYDGALLYGGMKWHGESLWGGWAEVVYTDPRNGNEFIWKGSQVRNITQGTVVQSVGVPPVFPGRYCARFVWTAEDGAVLGWHEGHCITL